MEISIIEAVTAIDKTIIDEFKDTLLLIAKTITGARKVIPVKKLIINLDRIVINRNDQKFRPEALKNSDVVKFEASFLRKLNCPPFRKTFIRKPANISINRPPEKKDIKILTEDPRSVNISEVKPCASFSVIMLFPNADLSPLLKGSVKTATRNNENNHVIKIPFQDFTAAPAPDRIEFNTFIS